MNTEILDLLQYIRSEESEKAKDHLIFPLFKKIFPKDKFKKESEAGGADLYIEGRLVVELKSNYEDWTTGFFQALHYQKKSLNFSALCVISNNFIGLWKLKDIPEIAIDLHKKSDALKSSSEVGQKNARSINIGQKNEILESAIFKLTKNEVKNQELYIKLLIIEFIENLNHLDSIRQQINPQNFIQKIMLMQKFFSNPMDAIHCFYTIVSYWDITCVVPEAKESKTNVIEVIGKNGKRRSEEFVLNPRHHKEFIQFVESHYIFTNEEVGITIDYYFSRFDEVLSKVDPEYTKQHGIFFTDINLSKFALWFVHYFYEKKLSEKYIVFDPAGGSGNLVTSWRKNHLKHKIVSELQPDLLKTIERRMQVDEMHLNTGFTVVPKTSENRGLNFLDKSAVEYMAEIEKVTNEKNLKLDKPFAFILNPPYKNTDENEDKRISKDANYIVHPTIIDFTGEDASKERYLSFLAQIINLTIEQVSKYLNFQPIILIFTPTSWLIPRPTYIEFRKKFDQYYKFETGFMITSYEFFKLNGRFPIAFTIWSYSPNKKGNKSIIKLRNYTHLKNQDLNIVWDIPFDELDRKIGKLIRKSSIVEMSNQRGNFRSSISQTMYDFKRDRTKEEINQKIVGGLPLKDARRQNKKTYGIINSEYIGLMDNYSPVRIKMDKYRRLSNQPDRVWFRLDSAMADINKTVCVNCPTPVKSYCAYDLDSAKILFEWFALSKAVNGRYPIWANQFEIWKPSIPAKLESYFYSLCFAFGLSENRCVVTKFEKDNPVPGAPEIFIDNPLCPTNPESFWCKVVGQAISEEVLGEQTLAKAMSVHTKEKSNTLISAIVSLYKLWNQNYCKGKILENVGLDKEPYFQYFDYPDFVTPYSGLIQIKRYAEIHNTSEILSIFEEIAEKTKLVKDEIYRLLVEECKYFG